MILYKYRDWNNDFHKRVLLYRELFFASPASFNDPYDCKIPIDYRTLNEDKEFENRFCKQVVERDFPSLTEIDKDYKVCELLSRRPWGSKEGIEKFMQMFYQGIDATFGVLSLIADKKQGILMWSHYANSHRGFCVGFHEKMLLERTIQKVGKDVDFGIMDYPLKMPQILPSNDYKNEITILKTKSNVWKYENEFRIISKGLRNQTIQFLPEDVAEIIIGYATPEPEKQLMVSICKLNFPDVPVYKVKPRPYEFILDFQQIG